MTERQPPPQGEDDIVINAPITAVWRLISDSQELERWGPPVRQVSVLDRPEILGSRRIVVAEFTSGGGVVTAAESEHAAKKKTANFEERRIVHIDGRKVGYRIEKENIGMFRMISDVGYTTELEPLGEDRTRVIWRFFHRPRGVFGTVMNWLFIVPQQRRNRLGALRALEEYAERVQEPAGQAHDV
jgi:uncharacterized protein YndB with AHSA1/START domain